MLAVGCASEPSEPLPIEVCGENRPVQILALDDAEVIDPWSGSARLGDRWIFGVRRFEIPLTSVASTTFPPDMRPFAQLDARVESVGACGEDRRVVAEDVDILFPPFESDGPWLGCRNDNGDLYWIHPDGASPARWITRVDRCGRHIVRGQDVYASSKDGDFVRAQVGDAGVTLDILVTDVVRASFFNAPGSAPLPPEDDAFLLRGKDRVLVRVDLSTHGVEEVHDRVDEFSISGDRRWLVWIRRVPDDPNDVSVPEARLLDRSTGEEHVLGRPYWSGIQAFVGNGFVVATGAGSGTPIETELISLPDVLSALVTEKLTVLGSDGNRIVISANFGSIDVLDLGTGERRTAFETYRPVEVHDGQIWYTDASGYAELDLPAGYVARDMMRIPIDTLAPPTLVRSRIFSPIELPGDRWATAVNYDENSLSDLVIIDGKNLDVGRIDDDLVGTPRPYDRSDADGDGLPWLTDELVYQVHERASDRGGMWRVKFTY